MHAGVFDGAPRHHARTHTCFDATGFSHRHRFPLCLRLHLLLINCAQVSHKKDFSCTVASGKAQCTVSGVVNVNTALLLKLRPWRSKWILQPEQFLSSGLKVRRRPPLPGAGDRVLHAGVFMAFSSDLNDLASQSTSAPTAGSGSSEVTVNCF